MFSGPDSIGLPGLNLASSSTRRPALEHAVALPGSLAWPVNAAAAVAVTQQPRAQRTGAVSESPRLQPAALRFLDGPGFLVVNGLPPVRAGPRSSAPSTLRAGVFVPKIGRLVQMTWLQIGLC